MEFTILGKTQLHVAQRPVALGASKQRGLLALLLLSVGRPVPIPMIAEQLWPDRSREQIRGNLQALVSRVRGALKRAGVSYQLRNDGDSYRLDLDPLLVDYHRFCRQANAGRVLARSGDHVQARELLRDAIAMWQGIPLTDLQTDWAQQRREQMAHSKLVPAQHALVESELALSEYLAVLETLQPLIDQYPLDETFARQWIQACDNLGRLVEATSFYTAFRQRMIAELGAEPGPELTEAHQHVLRRRSLTRQPEPVFSSERAGPGRALRVPAMMPRWDRNFTGRSELIAELDARLLAAGRDGVASVIALHGMPGVGKTGLVRHWAHWRQDRFPDGQLYVDLRGCGTGRPVNVDDVATLFLDELGVPADRIRDTGEQRLAKLGRLLADLRALVVLDNARDAPHVRPLLSAMVATPVIVTSRTRLTGLGLHDGAEPITVRPLGNAESAALLRRDIGPEAASDEAGLLALRGLAGGLPLALRLIGLYAAGHPGTSLTELAHDIADPAGLLDFLDDGEDEAATIRGVFSWSYRALPTDAARLFRLLGLHPGQTFSSSLAGALTGDDLTTTVQLLRMLTRVHLLESEGWRRYRLHDLLHAYANRCAHRDEPVDSRSAARARMADWYLRTGAAASHRLVPHTSPVPPLPTVPGAVPLTFDTDEDAHRWAQIERTNVLAMTGCAAGHGLHGHAWRMLGTMSEIFDRTGYQNDYFSALHVALESARADGDLEGQAGTLNHIGLGYEDRHDYRRAVGFIEASLSIVADLGYADGKAACQANLARLYVKLGEFGKAARFYRQSLQLSQELGCSHGVGYCLHGMGYMYHRLEQFDKALDYYGQALAVRDRLGYPRERAATLTDLSKLHYELGEYEQALGYSRPALQLHEQGKDQLKTIEALITLAHIHYALRVPAASADAAQRAVELCQLPLDAPIVAEALQIGGHALRALGNQAAARASWLRALTILDRLGSTDADSVRLDLDQLTAEHGVIPEPRSGKPVRRN